MEAYVDGTSCFLSGNDNFQRCKMRWWWWGGGGCTDRGQTALGSAAPRRHTSVSTHCSSSSNSNKYSRQRSRQSLQSKGTKEARTQWIQWRWIRKSDMGRRKKNIETSVPYNKCSFEMSTNIQWNVNRCRKILIAIIITIIPINTEIRIMGQ